MSIYQCICPGCGKHHILSREFMSASIVDDRCVSKCTECNIDTIRASWDARQNGTFDQFRVEHWKHNLTPDIIQRTIHFTEHLITTEGVDRV